MNTQRYIVILIQNIIMAKILVNNFFRLRFFTNTSMGKYNHNGAVKRT